MCGRCALKKQSTKKAFNLQWKCFRKLPHVSSISNMNMKASLIRLRVDDIILNIRWKFWFTDHLVIDQLKKINAKSFRANSTKGDLHKTLNGFHSPVFLRMQNIEENCWALVIFSAYYDGTWCCLVLYGVRFRKLPITRKKSGQHYLQLSCLS